MYIKNEKPLLSVVVPISKMAGRLSQLFFWVNQSKKHPIQIILVHDIADISTGEELHNFIIQNEFPDLILIQGKYGSPGFARNAGLEIATGEWIAFWDSDDMPILSSVLEALSETGSSDEIVIGRFSTRNTLDGSVRDDYFHDDSIFSVAMNPGIWRMIFKSNIITNVSFTDLKSGEDQVFLSQINFAEKNHIFIPKIFYEYSVAQTSQLTNSQQALMDLPCASRLILDNASKIRGDSLVFSLILIIRQQLSILKNGNLNLKFKVIFFMTSFIRILKFSMIKSTLEAIYFVVINIKKYRII